MDFERARFNMIEQQIRPWGVLDERVLATLARVPREDFVPPAYKLLAFADLELPLGFGQSMLTPKLEAMMLQALALEPTDTVLEIGTGSGYFTALLAHLVHHVLSVEIFPELSAQAGRKLAAHDIANVSLEIGDAARGWPPPTATEAPRPCFDAIVLTGSTPVLPEAYPALLKTGGRLVAVIGEAPVMRLSRIHALAPGVYESEDLLETVIPPLVNAPVPERFVL